ncbi:protein kinase [Cystobacter fuscus DSM 2262]|uniref:non-specific serine/threonine protein kinase n=1 Tax=Cystobacter fuscus (strain ATCC 25194 / DSM 2262 / NBRC 100088 / M29) TaxID=1242864 RepID=S9PHD4_CYSF2|nr:serine/threonine-protein kinase [Cystobacter fuscus]EPX62486.1 protein kinase [Cystobacter fuscus DSM 2262]
MKTTLEDVVQPGAVVGGYRIEKKLGAGGFGRVYLAWRDGGPCALKFIHLESVGEWGWRELYIMLRHEFPNVVRLLSHFKWPEEKPEYLVLVMEYVPGVTLYQWVRDNNPCAREVVEKLLPLTRALQEVHAKEVLHRDLKGDNVLVRELDGAPVLVDFGAGTMPGVPRVTRGSLAPANLRYRSPESVAFFLREDRKQGERYDYAVTDELYALGIILYVLTTDVYPFDGPDDELLGEIIADVPTPPNVRNSRVPSNLSDLCLRLLAKEPHARVQNAEALYESLKKLLEEAKVDPRWETPLCYGWTADGRTTEDAPELVGKNPQAWLRRWIRQKPKRGNPSPPPPASPTAQPAPSTAQTVSTLHARMRRLAPVLVAVVVVGLAMGAGHVLDQLRQPLLALTPPAVPDQRVWTLLESRTPTPLVSAESTLGGLAPWAPHVHEVAPPWKPPEADAGAAPPRVDTPALVTNVALSKGTTGMRKKAPGSQADKKKKGCGPTGNNVLLAVAAAANMACPGAQVRKEPASQECPAGAIETMRSKLDLDVGDHQGTAAIPRWISGNNKPIPVREGPITMTLGGGWGKLPSETVFSGQLFIGEKRVYGRITQAVTPSGDTFTVCMELWDFGESGLEIESDSEQTIKVRPRVELRTVSHFK